MKILMTKDVNGWAIGNLADSIMRYNKHFDFIDIPVHPRAVDQNILTINDLVQKKQIDVWHAQYWHSATQLQDSLRGMDEIPTILSHHNHYALGKEEWNRFSMITIPTEWGYKELTKKYNHIVKVPYGLDLDRFSYINDYNPEPKTIGYIGRVIANKNLKKIVEGAKKLKYKVIASGFVDKPDYWKEVDKDEKYLEFNGGMGRDGMMSADFKDNMYERMSIFCMYSTDNKETGTLPLLEAAARGVPILCTDEGMARDILVDGESCIKFDDDNFHEKLKLIMEDEELRKKIRENAYKAMIQYSEQRMARRFDRLYHDVRCPNEKMISVIIPTYNGADVLVKAMLAVESNEYKKKEIIVVDDGSTDHTKIVISEARKRFNTPIKYLETNNKEKYGLAEARNMGAMESVGDLLLFVDERLAIRNNTIEQVAASIVAGSWCFGQKVVKGKKSGKDGFVENFSWILRKDFMRSGMFCERMDHYGGMSQETRYRYNQQGYGFNYFPEIYADQIKTSRSRSKRRQDIWKAKLILQKLHG